MAPPTRPVEGQSKSVRGNLHDRPGDRQYGVPDAHIVIEKCVDTYRWLAREHAFDPSVAWMIGN